MKRLRTTYNPKDGNVNPEAATLQKNRDLLFPRQPNVLKPAARKVLKPAALKLNIIPSKYRDLMVQAFGLIAKGQKYRSHVYAYRIIDVILKKQMNGPLYIRSIMVVHERMAKVGDLVGRVSKDLYVKL